MKRVVVAAVVSVAAAAIVSPLLAGAPVASASGRQRVIHRAPRGTMDLPAPASAPAPQQIAPAPGVAALVSHAPGPVSSSEVVHVGFGPDGKVSSVVVDQTLRLTGTGDFFLVVRGPATAVAVPPSQNAEPTLRRGNVVWQGFVNGSRTLAATITLDPTFEIARLPMLLKVTRTGAQTKITLTDTTTTNAGAPNMGAEIGPLGAALDRARALLAAGKPAIAGLAGMPLSLPTQTFPCCFEDGFQVLAPLDVRGSVRTRLQDVAPQFSTVVDNAGVAGVLFDVRVAQPRASALTPPSGTSWSAFLSHAGTTEILAAQTLLFSSMWTSVTAQQYSSYLGNPVIGPAAVRYEYAPESVARPPAAAPARGAHAGSIALVVVALMLCLGTGTVLWRNS